MFGRKPVKATQFLEKANVFFFFHYQPAKIIGFQQVKFFWWDHSTGNFQIVLVLAKKPSNLAGIFIKK